MPGISNNVRLPKPQSEVSRKEEPATSGIGSAPNTTTPEQPPSRKGLSGAVNGVTDSLREKRNKDSFE
ncbi:hypothetical protein HPC49_28620 [Pyxidicoccus fallax]|uniref:Uncharacterized protein n=1 Tax=Pyxidicoccus fallax TaxID=394095 RepID=A0A848LTQ4_9BACT|nr:hypothetical protein [Pyxidicoccus fallax]NMO21166.1 hypothetical protein [Pyxidicoccus fallax]NPC82170.1 hypothetical protein [Pyxidicoccus fallax]